MTAHGPLDVVMEGRAPLDYRTLRNDAVIVQLEGRDIAVVGLAGLVALKRLAGRPRDREDLRRLADAPTSCRSRDKPSADPPR